MIRPLFGKISWKEDRCLFEHWIEHYQQLGVEHFFLLVHTYQCDDWTFVDYLQSHLDVTVIDTLDGLFDDAKIINTLNTYRQSILDDHWAIHADVDEFLDITPSDIQAICRSNADHVRGWLVDRIAEDGKLTEIKPDIPIERQFPLVATISKQLNIVRQKVPICRGYIELTGGHHRAKNGLRRYPTEIKINHYKWNASLLQKLDDRLNGEVVESQQRWLAEMKRTRDAIQNRHAIKLG